VDDPPDGARGDGGTGRMIRRPDWLRVRAPSPAQAASMRAMRELLRRMNLRTVCQGAMCPNAVECWGAGTATFMLLGETCTRACRFCGVPTGNPGGRLDVDEPRRISEAVEALGLTYVVLTSVDRDDLDDGGSEHFATTVDRIKRAVPDAVVEILVPDFSGDPRSLNRVLTSAADVLGHNIETVRSLSPRLRDPRAKYETSLAVLSYFRTGAKEPERRIKSGLMIGLGEARREISETLEDLRSAGVDTLSVGQYLPPTASSARVARYVSPEEFEDIAREGRALGFRAVVAGPLVRSSYHAREAYEAT
jgi:lipoic acid synthetase